ncbi:iron donor protein CyaY [Uliginosibacterium flavum]|uniref:Iron-sulfur cluster assembly protein CyaY n=1 Tax=Uliginosibacterium flavum TaxID=1396831 RepID=A0ABV2TIL6_9RHOO
MDEATFLLETEKLLLQLEAAIETAVEVAGVDVDVDMQAGGILQLVFENDSQIIINRHAVARQVWVAARAGGFHFRPEDGLWLDSRDGRELWVTLAELISQQAGVPVTLTR